MTTDPDSTERLCVVFLQDQREIEARMRTERLVSMGRMSTAVAHEIRNPLAAIVQANALLDEDIADPRLKRLTTMVRQNAQRLESIVDEILDIARVKDRRTTQAAAREPVNALVARICHEWEQHGARAPRRRSLSPADPRVAFDQEHLRRVLDQPAGQRAAPCQRARAGDPGLHAHDDDPAMWCWVSGATASRWSPRSSGTCSSPSSPPRAGPPGWALHLPRAVRGTGATIGFERTRRTIDGVQVEGNEFLVTMDPGGRDLSGAAASTNTARTMNARTPPNDVQILVVDDEPDLRTLYELALLREGYAVTSVGNLAGRAQAAGPAAL